MAGAVNHSNILLATCIAVLTAVLPSSEFYTKYYIQNVAVLWGTMISLWILFLPKLWKFIQQDVLHRFSPPSGYQHHHYNSGSSSAVALANQISFGSVQDSFYPTGSAGGNIGNGVYGDEAGSLLWQQRKPSLGAMSKATTVQPQQDVFGEQLDGFLPIKSQHVLLPFFSHWEMARIAVFPWVGYFSCLPERASVGKVYRYSHCSVVSRKPGNIIFKVHGSRTKGPWVDHLFQVEDLDMLERWLKCFEPTTIAPVTAVGFTGISATLDVGGRGMPPVPNVFLPPPNASQTQGEGPDAEASAEDGMKRREDAHHHPRGDERRKGSHPSGPEPVGKISASDLSSDTAVSSAGSSSMSSSLRPTPNAPRPPEVEEDELAIIDYFPNVPTIHVMQGERRPGMEDNDDSRLEQFPMKRLT
ncbi:uncharacterized protein VTP21DRAFT_4504 [Calcarisporiella thermophila]|uniref:uncharacterized protein n=1 Tax=Calcarisporiella thermophila TaxID=911321 RepID=UPI003744A1C0